MTHTCSTSNTVTTLGWCSPGNGLRLAEQPDARAVGTGAGQPAQDLDRDLAIQELIAGRDHHAHAAGAELLLHHEVADDRAERLLADDTAART